MSRCVGAKRKLQHHFKTDDDDIQQRLTVNLSISVGVMGSRQVVLTIQVCFSCIKGDNNHSYGRRWQAESPAVLYVGQARVVAGVECWNPDIQRSGEKEENLDRCKASWLLTDDLWHAPRWSRGGWWLEGLVWIRQEWECYSRIDIDLQ